MKKLTCLLVMLLLGSGLTQAIISNRYATLPTFEIWNVSNNTGSPPFHIIPGLETEMYFRFTTAYDIKELHVTMTLKVLNWIQDMEFNEQNNMYVEQSLPITRGTSIDATIKHIFPPYYTGICGDLTITFSNERGDIIATGTAIVVFE